MTHLPLEEVPEGTVDLHGHIHQHRLAGRRINVSVEQLEYRPWPLTALDQAVLVLQLDSSTRPAHGEQEPEPGHVETLLVPALERLRELGLVYLLWSDLHLGAVEALSFFGRSFRSVVEMDDVLCERWRSSVAPDDLVVCLGDVGTWQSLAGLQGLPGRKVLVFGNHDQSARGFDVVCRSVYSHGDSPLVLTHVPLRRVPPAWVNVHGHLHAGLVKGSTAHVNVSVEQLDYRPRRLTDMGLGGGSRSGAVVAGPDDGPVAGSARRAGIRRGRTRPMRTRADTCAHRGRVFATRARCRALGAPPAAVAVAVAVAVRQHGSARASSAA